MSTATDDGPSALAIPLYGLFRYLVLLFSLPVFAFLGLPLFEHAWSWLASRRLFDRLAAGIRASVRRSRYSFLSVLRGEGPIYFEVGCFILRDDDTGPLAGSDGQAQSGCGARCDCQALPEKVRRIKDGRRRVDPAGRSPDR